MFRFSGGPVRWINRHWDRARRHYTTGRQYRESGRRAKRAPCKALSRARHFSANCKCGANHEKFNPTEWKNCQGSERMCSRVRLRIYLIHNIGGCGTLSTREAKNYQRWRYFRDSGVSFSTFLDILFALNTLGFDPYVEPLKLYLTKYRESVKGDKSMEGEVVQEEMTLQPGQIVLGEGGQHVIIQGSLQGLQEDQIYFKSEWNSRPICMLSCKTHLPTAFLCSSLLSFLASFFYF